MQALSRLIGFARPRAFVIIFGFVLMICSTAADLIPTYLQMPLIDDVLIPRKFDYVWLYIVGFAGAWILTWLLTWARTYVLAYASEAIAADLRNRTYAHLQSLSIDYFGGKRTGDLIARVSTDTDRICYFLSVYVLDFANDLLMLLMTAALLLSINPNLAIVSLVPLPVIAFMVHKVRTRLRRGFQLGTRTWGEMTSVLADTIPGIRVVKAFAQERREVDRFNQANDRVFQANNRVNTLWAFFGATVVFLCNIGVLVIWIFGVYQIIRT